MNPPTIDLSIHELAEIRGAILHCIDQGRLVKGKREPWSFYPPDSCPNHCGHDPMTHDFEGNCSRLVPGTSATGWVRCGHHCSSPDWRMGESGDCNEQRTEFCDDIMGVLLKRIKESQ